MSKFLSDFFDAFLLFSADKMRFNVGDLTLGGVLLQLLFKLHDPLFPPWRQPFFVVDNCPLESVDSPDNITYKLLQG